MKSKTNLWRIIVKIANSKMVLKNCLQRPSVLALLAPFLKVSLARTLSKSLSAISHSCLYRRCSAPPLKVFVPLLKLPSIKARAWPNYGLFSLISSLLRPCHCPCRHPCDFLNCAHNLCQTRLVQIIIF